MYVINTTYVRWETFGGENHCRSVGSAWAFRGENFCGEKFLSMQKFVEVFSLENSYVCMCIGCVGLSVWIQATLSSSMFHMENKNHWSGLKIGLQVTWCSQSWGSVYGWRIVSAWTTCIWTQYPHQERLRLVLLWLHESGWRGRGRERERERERVIIVFITAKYWIQLAD